MISLTKRANRYEDFEGLNFFRELMKSLGETKMKNNLYCHCNLCGKEFNVWDYEENFQIHTLLGYGTAYDGDELHLRLCCDCMNEIIEDCYFSPIVEVNYCGKNYEFYDDLEVLADAITALRQEFLKGIDKIYKKIKWFIHTINFKTNK